MNLENVHAFFEKAKSDPLLQEKIHALGDTPSAEALVRLSEEYGLSFTEDDLHACAKHSGALVDEELAKVAGGFSIVFYRDGEKIVING